MCIVLAALAAASCGHFNENAGYTINVNSQTVGAAYGPAQYQIGMAYLSQDNYQAAVMAFDSAIGNGYSTRDLHFARARAYEALGLYSGAIGDASLCIDLNTQDVDAYELRGVAYLDSGDYAKAAADFTQALALNPSLKEAYFNRGMALRAMGRFTSAISDFDQALSLDASYLDAAMWLGRTYYSLTDYTQAVKQFGRALDIDPVAGAVAYNDRAVCEGRNGDLDGALADLNIAVGMHPNFYLAFYNRGVVYVKMNRATPAVLDLDTYLCLDANDRYGVSDLADGWRGYYPQYFVDNGEPELSMQAAGICGGIQARSAMQRDLPYSAGALYFPGERGEAQ